MAAFQPKQTRFLLRGVNLNRPVDLMEDGFYPVVTNVRSYAEGIIQTRPGWTTAASTGSDNIHSAKRLNDAIAASFARVVGASTKVYQGTTGAFTNTGSGYSGNGLTYAIVAPVRTPRAWCYIGDSLKLSKTKVGASTVVNWGIAPPTIAPSIQFGVPATTIVDDFDATAGWTATGAVGSIALDPRINTTITAIVFDTGSTGWASVQPATMVNFGRGVSVNVGSENDVILESFYPGTTSTTISAIAYDSGSTGLCSIALAAPTAEGWIKKFSMLTVGGEAVVVIDVIVGPDNIPSIRCSTTGTHSAGETVVGVRSFRAFFTSTHSAGQAIVSSGIEVVITGAGDGSTVIGTLTKPVTVDASIAGGRPIDPENDEVHLSVYVSKLNHWIDATLALDVDASVNDGTQNYYFKTLTVNDFAGTDPTDSDTTVNAARLVRLEQKLKNATQAGDFDRVRDLQQRILTLKAHQDQVLNIPLDDQSAIGDHQWHELRFKTKEFFRAGTDFSRTLKDVKAIVITIRANKTRTLRFDSCWIGGTFGPDVGSVGAPYRYMYRYRSSETGVTSAWSPPTRTGIEAHRQRVVVTPTVSTDPQVDKIDYARIGGVIGEFTYIGTAPNSGSFNDDQLDAQIISNDLVELNSFQPFPITDLPKTGTVNVAGVSVSQASGDSFNTAWARNSFIIIDGIAYTLYGPPTSTTRLQINENAKAGTGVSYYMPGPLLTGQPLPAIWGPVGYGQTGVFIFACGDSKNAGDIWWTNGNDPDLAHDGNTLSVSSPSEPLVMGCVWDYRNFVFSSEAYYEIFPNFSLFPGTIGGQSQFVTQRISGSIGLFNKYCLAPGKDGIYFLGNDGIYFTQGGAPVNITDESLQPLFPHEGIPGVAVNGYNPVDFTKPMRLSYYNEFVYFCFTDTQGAHCIWIYNASPVVKGWIFDKPNSAQIVPTVVYGEEGDAIDSLLLGGITAGGTGTLWTQGGTSDDGQPILCELDTKAEDFGDDRLNKNFGDYILDIDTGGITLTSTPGFNNYGTLLAGQSVVHSGRTISPPLDLNSGAGQIALNMGVKLTWSSASVVVSLYAWQLSYVTKPVNTILRFTDWSNLGVNESKFVHGIRLHADTLNAVRSLRIQGDNGLNGLATTDITLTGVQHNGESIIDYSFEPPFIAHLLRLAPNDANQWRLFDDFEFQFDIDSPLVLSYQSQVTSNDLQGYQHIRDGYIAHISTADISFVWVVDGVTLPTINIPNGGGVFTKTYFIPPANKWKTLQYKLQSTAGFRLYKRACEVRCKPWGSAQAYQILTPFGEIHFNEGPRL